MSEDVYSQFLRGTVTESANSTFTEGDAIVTGASVNRIEGRNLAIEIHRITCSIGFPEDLPSSGNTERITFALSTRTGLTSMPGIDERHVVYKNATSVQAGVAVYLPLIWDKDIGMPHDLQLIKPILLAHPYLYPYILSTNSATAASCDYVITYNFVFLDPELMIEALESYRYGD